MIHSFTILYNAVATIIVNNCVHNSIVCLLSVPYLICVVIGIHISKIVFPFSFVFVPYILLAYSQFHVNENNAKFHGMRLLAT